MVSRRAFFKGAVVLAALAPGLARAETKMLKGTVFYRERMALPPGAVVKVRLIDVSRADAPSVTIAETEIAPDHEVPVPFELHYDDAAIVPKHSYALAARIELEGRLLFINTTRHAVLTGGADRTDILVEMVAAQAEAPVGRWLAEDILGGGVLDNVQTVLEIGADGKVSGSGGCNGIMGTAKIKGDGITFGPIAATRKACVPAVGDQEQKFFQALGKVRRWQADPEKGKLTLLGRGGKVLMVLAAHG